MRIFSRPNYEIGTAPLEEIVKRALRDRLPEKYKGVLSGIRLRQDAKKIKSRALGIGYDGDWSIRVDKAARKACLQRHLFSNYGVRYMSVEIKYMEPKMREKALSEIRAFKDKSGDGAARMIADYVGACTAEEVCHCLGAYEHEDERDGRESLINKEDDHAFFLRFSNPDKFTEKNTVDLGD